MQTRFSKLTGSWALAVIVLSGMTANSFAATIISPALHGLYSVDNGTPNSPGNRLDYLNNSIALWNANDSSEAISGNDYSRLNGSLVPLSLVPGSFTGTQTDINWSSTSFDLGSDPVLYLYVHFGGYGISYYLGGLTGEITIDNGSLTLGGGGVSTVSRFLGTPTTPDAGATLGLVGLAFGCLGFARRFVRA